MHVGLRHAVLLMHYLVTFSEKNEMTEEAQQLITVIQQMEESLGDEKANGQYHLDHNELQISYPLNRCLMLLREKHGAVSKLHRERFEQVKSEYLQADANENRVLIYWQSWSRPWNPTHLISKSHLSPLNFLPPHLDRQFHPVSIFPLLGLLLWMPNSRKFTKNTIAGSSLCTLRAKRSLSSGLSLELPRCKLIPTF